MDNPALDNFDEDIDARLARFDEEIPKEDDIKIFCHTQLFKKDDKDKDDEHVIYNKRIHKEDCDGSSHPLSKPRSFQEDWDHRMTTGHEKETQTGGNLTPSVLSKSHLLEKGCAPELNISSREYSNKQRNKVTNQKDQNVDYLSIKTDRNTSPNKYLVLQGSKVSREGNQLTDSCNRIKSNIPHKNVPLSSLSSLNRKEIEIDNEVTKCKRNSHYTSDSLIYDNVLKDNKITNLESNAGFIKDENYQFVSSEKNGARMKNFVRDSCHHRDIDELKKLQYEERHGQIEGNTDFKKGSYGKHLKAQIDRQNEYVSNYSRYADFKQNKNKKRSSEINEKQYLQSKDKRLKGNESQICNDQQCKLGLNRKNNNFELTFHKPDRCDSEHLQHGNFKQNVEINSNFGIGNHSRSIDDFEIGNHSRSIDDFEMNHKDIQNKSVFTINATNLDDRYVVHELKGNIYKNKIKHRNNMVEEDKAGVWKRHNAYNKEISNRPLNSEIRAIINRKPAASTLTMHDAHRIAPMFLNCPIRGNSVEQDAFEVREETMHRNKRRCWAKLCWSNTKHSHALSVKRDLYSWANRNAIVSSMRSPQYATKSKKETFTAFWSSFLKASASRFELWSRTLKKIEGQFGTGVVSYFVFLRWLILLNFVIFILYFFLIILPYSVFALLPHQNIKIAPNTSLLTDEYLQQFPKHENIPFTRKRIGSKNISLGLDGDLLSHLGTLLDNYVPDEILDVTMRYDKRNYTGEERRRISLYCVDQYEKRMANHTKETFSFLQDFLQGTGWLQSTILFLGFYPDRDVSYFGLPYNLPVSFLAVFIVSFFLSLVLMVQYSSHGIQENVLTRKSNYMTFSNILFCSWDYCIEDKKTADIRHKSITCEIKSNLAEDHRKLELSYWSSEKWMRVYMLRATINIIIIGALFGAFYLIYRVVNFQLELQRQNALEGSGVYTLCIQFLPPLVITLLNIVMPIIFYMLVKFEMYSTQTQVNIALFRIVFLRLASVFVLVSSLYQQLTCEPKDNCRAGIGKYCRTPICWETYVGQQLYKLVITDFLVYVCMFLAYDLPRDFIVQRCKCKVTEVVGRQVFDLPSQVLSLVYSQTLCWLGLLYSPLLPGISVLKFLIIFYIKKVVVLKHCVPAPVLYKASRSNSIFMTVLMISFFVVTMIHGYSLTSIEPSPGCSPFRQYIVMIHAISHAIYIWSPDLVNFMTYVFSGFFFIPGFLLLSVIIYYYWTVVIAHRQMTKVLKAQIAVEGRDKQFLLNRLAEAARQATTS